MKINIKRKDMAAWLSGAALVAMVAGCGGGGSSPTIPSTAGITVPAPVEGKSELLFSANRAADNASKRPGLFLSELESGKVFFIPIAGFQGARDRAWLPGRRELLYVGFAPQTAGAANLSVSSSEIPPGIRRVNRDGTNDREIPNSRGASGLSVSPDGRRIAYGFTQIRVCDIDGGNSRVVREGSAPTWSPDGARLVFSSFSSDSSAEQRGDVYTMNADGSDARRLTSGAEFESFPEFSPDGKRIVFQSNVAAEFQTEIFVMNADGSGRTRLTNNQSFDSQPKWTPDGKRIAFISGSNVAQGTIQIMNADGNGQRRLLSDLVNGFDMR